MRRGLQVCKFSLFIEPISEGPSNPMNLFNNIFGGDIWTKLRMNPNTAPLLNQPDFVQIMSDLQKNPSNLSKYMSDKRVMQALGALMGIPTNTEPQQQEPPKAKEPEKPKEPEKQKPKEPEPEPMKIDQTPEQQQAEALKNKGNDAYKNKNFDLAIDFYNQAMEKDPNNVLYLLNRAAVYLEQSKIEECVNDCRKAIEDGRKLHVDYTIVAKALVRIGNAYSKAKDYGKAVEAYQQALTEHRTPETLNLLKKAEKSKEEFDRLSYLDPVKSQEAKEQGNQFFKESKIPEAIKAYTEAIKRNPNDHTLYSNRAACYTKIGEYPLGLKDCEKCIEMKPDFVKGYTRKGHIQYFMKEYQKALETYDQGLKLDENNAELQDGIKRAIQAMNDQINKNRQGAPDQETLQRAMQDPEVQQILADPVMRQILEDMQSDPKAAQNHMRNPMIMGKIQKLINAGVLRTG
jgi:stress-induced-phosphoprotein 1